MFTFAVGKNKVANIPNVQKQVTTTTGGIAKHRKLSSSTLIWGPPRLWSSIKRCGLMSVLKISNRALHSIVETHLPPLPDDDLILALDEVLHLVKL